MEFEDYLGLLHEPDLIIVVEGKEDEAALAYLGVLNVMRLNKQPIFSLIEEVAESGKRVAILTDLDQAGKRYYAILKHELSQKGVTIDDRFRHYLFRETKLRQIEGLPRYLARLD